MSIAIIGTGIFAQENHLPAIRNSSLNLIGCFNRTREKADLFAKNANISVYASLDQLLNDPNLTAIDALVPVTMNLELVKAAIQAGKPIIIEKPIAGSLDQAKEIVRLSEKSDLPIMVAENWLFHSYLAKIISLLPQIGEVATFSYSSTRKFFFSKYHQTSWRAQPKHIGGFLSDGGVHQLALLTGALGDVSSVSAATKQLRQENGGPDTLSAHFTLASGASGTFLYATSVGSTPGQTLFSIYGTRGSLHLKKEKTTTLELYVGEDHETFEFEQDSLNGVQAEIDEFARALKEGKEVLTSTPRKAYHHLAIVAACLESARKGTTERVDKVEDGEGR